MLGAIIGDIVGSVWEFCRPRPKEKDVQVWPFPEGAGFTDDTLLTLAVGQALMDADGDLERGPELVSSALRRFATTYRLQRGGYGGGFLKWLVSKDPQPYGSAGNGSAMRVSAAGWLYPTLELTEQWAEIAAAVSHNHPDGIAGAQATAGAIFLARTGHSKEDIKNYAAGRYGYDLDRTWAEVMADDPDGMKPNKMLAAKTVPEALLAFLGANDFESTIQRAVSVGGDTDTRAAIAGAIAEGFWGVNVFPNLAAIHGDPEEGVREDARAHLPGELQAVLDRFEERTRATRLTD